jgi:hypothetical protein
MSSGPAPFSKRPFPVAWPRRQHIKDDLDNLRTRFWLATSVHRDPNNYAYYGDRNGKFFGLWRHSETEAELRLRSSGNGPATHLSLYRNRWRVARAGKRNARLRAT